jgi:hypothetical protein
MRHSFYLCIAQGIEEHDNYFVQKRNIAGALGFSCLTAAYKQLAYAILADYVDEYVCIGESNVIEYLRRSVRSLATNILGLQNKMIQSDCLILLNDMNFLECLIASIVCIKSKKIVQLLGEGCTVVMSKNQ